MPDYVAEKDKYHSEHAPIEIKQVHVTGGNVVSPVEGFASDAGLGLPPKVGCYGHPDEGHIPTGEKVPGATKGGLKAYFKGHGGGKP